MWAETTRGLWQQRWAGWEEVSWAALSRHGAWRPSPSRGRCGTGFCCQHLPRAVGLAGVACQSQARKNTTWGRRGFQKCVVTEPEKLVLQLKSFLWGFSRLVSSLASARLFLSAEELPGLVLLLLCSFTSYLAMCFANWCGWAAWGTHTQKVSATALLTAGLTSKPPSPEDLGWGPDLGRGERNKLGDLTQSRACAQGRTEGTSGELGSPLGDRAPLAHRRGLQWQLLSPGSLQLQAW